MPTLSTIQPNAACLFCVEQSLFNSFVVVSSWVCQQQSTLPVHYDGGYTQDSVTKAQADWLRRGRWLEGWPAEKRGRTIEKLSVFGHNQQRRARFRLRKALLGIALKDQLLCVPRVREVLSGWVWLSFLSNVYSTADHCAHQHRPSATPFCTFHDDTYSFTDIVNDS